MKIEKIIKSKILREYYFIKGSLSIDTKYFIKKIEIVRKSSPEDISLTTVYNPVITSVDADGLDYSDSTPMKYGLTFAYEGFTTVSGDSKEFRDLLIDTGLENSETIET